LVVITAGLMLSLFMSSTESTIVATAMPTIVAQLGGFSAYSWVFSAFMLASTTTVPIFGKLSDLYGRRPVYLVAMVLFLVGSLLCGLSQSMTQLIIFRVVQGLGAGGLLPLVFTIIGDIFTLEQRARMQGLFSGVWGVSSIVGPLLGGFLVDQVSWHWIFYINILPGLLALALVWMAWDDVPRAKDAARPAVDFWGAALLSAAVVVLLLGLFNLGTTMSWLLIAGSVVLFAALLVTERRAADPILPLPLFRDRLFAVACLHGILAGWAMFGTASFVPLFAQAVLGTSATAAGAMLTPQLLSWVFASIIGSRLLLRFGYRPLALIGMVLLTLGTFLLTRVSVGASQISLMFYLGLMGAGMGLSIPAFLIAVQSAVHRSKLGAATSTIQFSRSIGGTLGVSVMGAMLSIWLNNALTAAGLDSSKISVQSLIDPLASANQSLEGPLRAALASAMQGVFIIALVGAALGLVATFFSPRGLIAQESGAAPVEAPLPELHS
jgi:EmrB/QacA subfamily drug resistance transporter